MKNMMPDIKASCCNCSLAGRRMDGTKRSMVSGEVGRFKDEAYTLGV
jgi:hypothetical protein